VGRVSVSRLAGASFQTKCLPLVIHDTRVSDEHFAVGG